tara:strand:+ start:3229 stop:6294 length:3066 start_codon:yes stop_codon:yes gene_type:complete
MRLVFPQLFAAALLVAPGHAQNVDFNRDVRPILSEYCYACHGPDAEAREADLRLDLEAEAKKDFGGYFALMAQRPDESEVWLRVETDDPDEIMPPPKAKKPLSDTQKTVLKRWIEQGANYAKHWAYVKPEKADVPKAEAPHFPARNAIDGHVLSRLKELGLTPSAEAPPNQLMRRVSLDLTGLPPSPEELQAFLTAWETDSEKAYEALVDRLLDSPRFGEKWARPWLDLARYADSNGFQADQLRDSWAYRDWVIDALNANMPYDQFTIEQLAGDLLPNATLEQKIATGFHRTVTCNVEAGVHPEANRVDQVVDRVNTTGTVWLGSTMECAQCHDHKYDPFTMKDYYSMFAYFNQTPVEVRNPSGKGVSFDFYGPKMELPMSSDDAAKRQALQAGLAALEAQRKPIAKAANQNRHAWEESLRERVAREPSWEALQIEHFAGSEGEGFKPLDDGSILVTGKVPDKSSYTIRAKGDLQEAGAIRLEVLADESLPANGPARGNGSRPNIVLTEFRLLDANGKEVGLSGGVADYSQPYFDPNLAIDGDNQPRSAWAINPEFGKDHWIAFKTDHPVNSREGLRIELDQFYGGSRVIGRLRLAVLKGDPIAISIPENIANIIKTEAGKRSAKDKKTLDDFFLDENPELAKLNRQIAETKRKLSGIEPDTTLVMVEQEEMRETRVMKRGNYLNPAEKVEMATPAILHPLDPGLPGNRLGFAQWLVSTDNPLVARVAVNRWWNEIFGHGIVATLEDFGTQSEPPTHPELLDWLAVEFMESGWNMKQVLRKIVLSSTYRQDSRMRPDLKQVDPMNHFYARGPRFRLSAEGIRDHGLAASGLLSTRMGGEPVMPYQPPGMWRQVGRNEPKWIDAKDENRFRRGIYIVYRRAAPYPSFVSFDATDRGACTVKRGRTNTPLQALTLLNDPAYIEMALGLADRVLTTAPGSDFQARLHHAFQLALQRPATNAELHHLQTLYQGKMSELTPESANQLIAEPAKVVRPQFKGSPSELAAWFYIANILLNLDEAISKG